MRIALAVLLATLSACASAPRRPTRTELTGQLAGQPIHLVEAIFLLPSRNWPGRATFGFHITLSDTPGLCARLQQNAERKSSSQLIITAQEITTVSGRPLPADPTEPGVLHIDPMDRHRAFVSVTRSSATCWRNGLGGASSGTVTLAAIGPAHVAGTVDALFSSGDHLTGEFDAVPCLLDNWPVFDDMGKTPPPACE